MEMEEKVCIVCREIIGNDNFECVICKTNICNECFGELKIESNVGLLRCPVCRQLILNHFRLDLKTLTTIYLSHPTSYSLMNRIYGSLVRSSNLIYLALFIRDKYGELVFPTLLDSYLKNTDIPKYIPIDIQHFRNDLLMTSTSTYLEHVEKCFNNYRTNFKELFHGRESPSSYIDWQLKLGIFNNEELEKINHELTSVSSMVEVMSHEQSLIIFPSFEHIFSLIFRRFLTTKTLVEYSIFMDKFLFMCPNPTCSGRVDKFFELGVCYRCRNLFCPDCRKLILSLDEFVRGKYMYTTFELRKLIHPICDEDKLCEIEKIRDKPVCRFCRKTLTRTFDKFVFCDYCENLYSTNSRVFGGREIKIEDTGNENEDLEIESALYHENSSPSHVTGNEIENEESSNSSPVTVTEVSKNEEPSIETTSEKSIEKYSITKIEIDDPDHAKFYIYSPTIEEIEMINPSIDFWIGNLFDLTPETLKNVLTKIHDEKLVKLITEIHSMTRAENILDDLSKFAYEIYHNEPIVIDKYSFKRFIGNKKIIKLILPLIIVRSYESTITNAIINQNIGLLESLVESFKRLSYYFYE